MDAKIKTAELNTLWNAEGHTKLMRLSTTRCDVILGLVAGFALASAADIIISAEV